MTGHFTGQTCQARGFACCGRVRVLPCLPCYLVQTLVLVIVKASSKIGIGVKKRYCSGLTYMTASAIVNSLSRTDSMAEADVELLQSDRFYGLSRGRIPSVGQFLWPRQRSTTFFSQG